jgi:hypothetical protein
LQQIVSGQTLPVGKGLEREAANGAS